MNKPVDKVTIKCAYCGKPFETYKSLDNRRKYCSSKCYVESRKGKKVTLTCPCGQKFKVSECLAKTRKYCSTECFHKYADYTGS